MQTTRTRGEASSEDRKRTQKGQPGLRMSDLSMAIA